MVCITRSSSHRRDLLDNDRDNISKQCKSTALHAAAYNGHKDIVEILLKEGADLNAQNQQGVIALHLAAQNSRKETVEILSENSTELAIIQMNDRHSFKG